MTTDIIQQHITTYRNCRVKHAKFTALIEEVMFQLHDSPSTGIVCVVGPTGAGKSLARHEIEVATIKRFHETMVRERHVRPVISTLAISSGNTKFSWGELIHSALMQLGDPFSFRSSPREIDEEFQKLIDGLPALGSRPTIARMLRRVTDNLKLRKTAVWCVDEAQHAVFEDRKGGNSPEYQLAVFKNIVELAASSKLLLLGPPNLARQFYTSGQLSRRSRTVYFTRYRADREDELREFTRVCNTLLHHMRPVRAPAMDEIGTMLYCGTAGCVGVLKDWLERAMTVALMRAGCIELAAVTVEDLRATRIDPEAMGAMMRDIQYMERSMVNRGDDSIFERMVLGGDGGICVPDAPVRSKRRVAAVTSRPKPGVRGPVRDLTGSDAVFGVA